MTEPTGPYSPVSLATGIRGPHGHIPLAVVNDQELVLAVNEVAYPWHQHSESDELFIVLSGCLTIERADRPPIELHAGDIAVIQSGTWHRTVPTGRTVNLILKRAGAATVFESDAPPGEIPGGEE